MATKIPRAPDKYPAMLAQQLAVQNPAMPRPVLEHVFHEGRKFRFDLAWPDRRLAVEVDGSVHRIRERFDSDIEKYQLAFLGGWRVLRVSTLQVRKNEACQFVWMALLYPPSPTAAQVAARMNTLPIDIMKGKRR